jgi:hypothetical protein
LHASSSVNSVFQPSSLFVTLAARGDLVGQVAADDVGEGLDHLEDGAAAAAAEVPGFDAGLVRAQVVECHEVALCEVEHVDVVADGGAVFGFVVWMRAG